MKTVLGFDSWTEGSHHYCRLVSALKSRGFALKLIHLGSWGHDAKRPDHEMIGDLPVFDIRYYRGKSFRDILNTEAPAAVIFLSTEAFLHRAFNRYAAELGIPTLHLYHGLIGVQATESGQPDHYNVFSQFKLILTRSGKLLTRTFPVYGKALIDTKASANAWLRFFKDVLMQGFGRYNSRAACDARTRYCGVYTKADVAHAVNKYGVPEKNVRVLGNPDLTKFGLREVDLGGAGAADNLQHTRIMYIDHGGSTSALNFRSSSDFVEYLVLTRDELLKQGYSLQVKLHPAQRLTATPQLCKEHGIQVCDDQEFLTCLFTCRAALVGPSSAALIPALLGLPILLACYGKFSGQKYGKVLMSYPRAIVLTGIGDVKHHLSTDRATGCNSACVDEWLVENVGPLPAETMPDRVASLVAEMVAPT